MAAVKMKVEVKYCVNVVDAAQVEVLVGVACYELLVQDRARLNVLVVCCIHTVCEWRAREV
jgi:hypothetical protein